VFRKCHLWGDYEHRLFTPGDMPPSIVELGGMKTSYAVVPGIRQVSKSRLQELIGAASPDAMVRIGEALTLYLGG